MASNRAEVLFDQIVHSTPKFSSRSEQPGAERGWSSGPSERISPVSGSAAFQPPLDPPDGADDSEVHLSNLEEPPSGDLQGAELQTTQHLTEGLEEGSSSPSNKVHFLFLTGVKPDKFFMFTCFLFFCRKT